MIRMYINGTEVQDFDWSEISLNIKRDRDNRIVRITSPQTMTMTGDAYAILNDLLVTTGWCASAEVEIQKACGSGYKTIMNGLIFLTDCEFNKQRCQVDVTITDNSFYAKLFNNSKIEYNTASPFSKNRQPITTPTALDIEFFKPSDGTYNSGFTVLGTRKCYDWKDVLEYLLKFVSDDEATLVSSWYDALDEHDNLCIVTGRELRLATGEFKDFSISFEDLTTDVYKYFNLWTSFNGQEYQVEQDSYYFDETSLFTIDKVKDVKHSALQSEYYSAVKFGTYQTTDTAISFPVQHYTTFNDENFYFLGQCNIVNELDLTGSKFIVDSNVIEDVLINDNDAFDDDLFLIRYDTSNNKATRTYYSAATKYFYNELMLNEQVAQRYSFNSSLYAVRDEITDRFRASFPSGQIGPEASPNPLAPTFAIMYYTNPAGVEFDFNDFADDSTSPNYDTDNRFNTSTNVYTAPQDGMYTFQVIWRTLIDGFLGNPSVASFLHFDLVLVRSVQGNISTTFTDINGNPIVIDWRQSGNSYEFYATITTYLESGETVTPKYNAVNEVGYESTFAYGNWQSTGDCVFECLLAPETGGEYKQGDTTVFKSSIFTFEQKLTDAQVTDLLTSPANAFTFNEDGRTNKKVWIDDVTINIKDNFATIQAVSDITNSGA